MSDDDIITSEIEDLMNVHSALPPSDRDFIEAAATTEAICQLASGKPFPWNAEQVAKLHQIWDKHCGSKT